MIHLHYSRFFLFIFAGLLFAALTGCAGTKVVPIESPEREQVIAQAEPITENLIQGMLAHDYTTFSRDFDPSMKKAMDEKGFLKMMETIDPAIGQYQSRQVSKVEEVGNYVAVTYTMRFELEDGVSWRVVLSPANPMQVSGFWYDSPKLRGAK